MTQDPQAARPSEPPADATAGGDFAFAHQSLTSLLGRDVEPQRPPVRPLIVGMAFLALGILALNLAIEHTTRARRSRERWESLTTYTEARRGELRTTLKRFESEARYVADYSVSSWTGAAATVASDEERLRLERDLDGAAATFGFAAVALLGPDGALLGGTSGTSYLDLARGRSLAARAAATGRVERAVDAPPDARTLVWLALPLSGGDRAATGNFLLVAAPLGDLFNRTYLTLPVYHSRSGAFLVRAEAGAVRVLSAPPSASGFTTGDRVAAGDSRAPGAVDAAAGRESAIDATEAAGGALWVVTRALPELGLGLVGQADRGAMLAGARETRGALIALDLGIVVLALPAFWVWRRRALTARMRRERVMMQRQLDRLRVVFDHAFDSIITFDQHGRVRVANRAAEQLFGRTASGLLGAPVQQLLGCAGPERPDGVDARALRGVTRSEVLRPDGSRVPVEYSLATIDDQDQKLTIAIVRDIGDRLRAEGQLRSFAEGLEVTNRRLEEANAQLEEASRLKSEFLANTSHELRTPLNGMIGFLQLVLDGMCDSRDEEKDFLEQALQCSRRLLGLINDVLDIAKIEAGKLSLDIEAVDIRSVFGETYTLTHVQAAQKGLKLTFEPPGGEEARARGDFNKVKQVLVNLVGNSLKFTNEGGITVRATERPDLGHMLFEVIDTGIGIPEERQKMIFEKFTQADGSSTRKHGGTGLGLAISKSLIELMGGIIDVRSEGPGKGTCMMFSLPLWRSEEEDLPDNELRVSDRIEGPNGGPLILVVEDDPVFRQFLTSLLHHHGYRTVEAGHAEGGWVLARRLRPALVVLDYALSSAEGANLRTGWHLAERMTTDPATRHIPLIFVTGFDLQIREKLQATLFSRRPEHLMKPVDAGVLVRKIEELVERRSGTVRILMADDDPSVVAYVRKVLPETRFHIEVANNGDECLHILRTQPHGFDLLMLDLMMPDVSGYDVLRDLGVSKIHQALPVLILTNFPEARSDDEKRLLERGVVLDVIAKPAVHDNPRLLSHIIEWHLQVAAELGHGAPEPHAGEPSQEAA